MQNKFIRIGVAFTLLTIAVSCATLVPGRSNHYNSSRNDRSSTSSSQPKPSSTTADEAVLQEQQRYLTRAKRYYANRRYRESRVMCKRIINLAADTSYAAEARSLRKRIDQILK